MLAINLLPFDQLSSALRKSIRFRLYMRRWNTENPGRVRDTQRAMRSRPWHRTAHKEYAKQYHRTERWGLSPGAYEKKLEEQGGHCALCLKIPGVDSPKSFHIDRDHKLGRLRGILCPRCNMMIGFIDNALAEDGRLDRIIDYARHSEWKRK
ncbi:MAG: endonuclease domain-containing protein [Terriglobales bacterium]